MLHRLPQGLDPAPQGPVLGVGDGAVAAHTVDAFRLDLAVSELYADLRVEPVLDRLLEHSRALLGTVAGSISLVDATQGRYDKLAERDINCRLGMSFPLDEGATGQAVTRRMPVVIDDTATCAVVICRRITRRAGEPRPRFRCGGGAR
jgi:hypothetical protein